VQWFLAIPHYLVAYALGVVRNVITFIALFAILFTKKYPEAMFNLVVMTHRYQWRVNSYAFFMRESYPPFEFDTIALDQGNDPARLSVAYAPEMHRWLPLVKWFLAIPHYFVMIFRSIAAFFVGLAAFFMVLFTGRWSERMRTYLVDVARYSLRVQAYAGLLRDEYPPFTMK
jgi:hypothetical protein